MGIFGGFVDYFLILALAGLTRGFSLFNSLIIARILGPSDFGIFAIFYAVMVLTWQLPQAFDGIYVTFARKTTLQKEKDTLLKTSIVLKSFYLICVLFLSYPLSLVLAKYCFRKEALLAPLVFSMVCGVSVMFLMTVSSVFQEQGRFAKFASINTCYSVPVFATLSIAYFLDFSFTLHMVFAIYVTVFIAIGILTAIILYNRVGNFLDTDKTVLRSFFKQGKWFLGIVALSCLFERIDIFFLARLVDLHSLGLYSVAAQMTLIVGHATGSLSGLSMPRAGEAVRSRAALRSFFNQSLGTICLICSGILLFIFTAPSVITTVYGNEYAMAGPLLRILLIGWIFRVIFTPFSFLFVALGDSRTKCFLEALKLVLGGFLLVLLLKAFPLVGAAYAIALTFALDTGISFWVLHHRLTRTHRHVYSSPTVAVVGKEYDRAGGFCV